MRTYTANQTLFVPLVYMLDRFAASDTLVLMPEAQYNKTGNQSRTTLMSKNGELEVVVPLSDRQFKALEDVRVFRKERWAAKFSKTLQALYGKAAYYKEEVVGVEEVLHTLLLKEDLTCADVGEAMIRHALKCSGITCSVILARDLVGERNPDATQWLVDMGVALEADAYIGGAYAMDAYIKHDLFNSKGISLLGQCYKMTPYKGVHGEVNKGTIGYLDPLFNGGKELLRKVSNARAYPHG